MEIVSTKKQRNILIVALILLVTALGIGFQRYSSLKSDLAIAEQNKKALADTLRFTTNKVGDIEASKNILIADNKDLKDLNSDLAAEVKKEKGKVRELQKIIAEFKPDTIYITNTLIKYSDGSFGLSWQYDTIFSLNNERHLAGISKFRITKEGEVTPLNTMISKDVTKFSLVTGLREKDGNIEIFVRSDYPDFKVADLQGAIIDPKQHPVVKKFTQDNKRFGIGPYVGVGLGVNAIPQPNIGLGFSAGIGIHYSLIRF